MPIAISILWELLRNNEKSDAVYNLALEFDKVLALKLDKKNDIKVDIPDDIKEILEKRKIARESKDFVESDRLRDILKEKGYVVKDQKDCQKIEKV